MLNPAQIVLLLQDNRGGFSQDDNFLCEMNEEGDILKHKRHNLDDDQMWDGPIKDLDDKFLYFGEEADDGK